MAIAVVLPNLIIVESWGSPTTYSTSYNETITEVHNEENQ